MYVPKIINFHSSHTNVVPQTEHLYMYHKQQLILYEEVLDQD